MDNNCPFCRRVGTIPKRLFFESDGWFAFLDEKPLTYGHTILAKRLPPEGGCPEGVSAEHLSGHDRALNDTVERLQNYYEWTDTQPKDFLFASLRGNIKHFHTHIIPLWLEDESRWRADFEGTGRLFEFLGFLDATRAKTNRSSEEQKMLESYLVAMACALRG